MSLNKVFQPVLQTIRPFFEIRPGERAKTWAMFSYFFLTIALIYILKPVRGALFLGELGAQNLRYVYMGEGLFLIFVTAAYVKLSRALPRKVFFLGVLAFFAANLVLFWFLFRIRMPYLSAFFYVWVASFSITMTTQFWLLANDIFTPEEAKRLFGLIISGGSAGGVLGGLMTQQAVRWLKTEELLLVAAGVVLVCMALVALIWPYISRSASTDAAHAQEDAKSVKTDKPDSVRRIFMGSSYLVMLVLLVIMAKVGSTIVDNQFNRVVELSIAGKEARTAFFGGFMAGLNVVSLLAQLIFTSLCLRYLGLGVSLAILPVGLGLLSIPGFFFPVLASGLMLKLFDGSVNYSIQQASKEVLFLPIARQLRYRVKPIIDMLGFRAAKSLGGLYIALAAPLFHVTDEKLSVLVLAMVPFWAFLVWRMKRGYSELLRGYLTNRPKFEKSLAPVKATDVMGFLHDEKLFHDLRDFMDHRSSYVRKIAATACLAYSKLSKDLTAARAIAERLAREESVEFNEAVEEGLSAKDVAFLREWVVPEAGAESVKDGSLTEYLESYSQNVLEKISPILGQTDKVLGPKRRAIKILELLPRQESVDLLFQTLRSTQDHAYRFIILNALTRLHDKNPKLRFKRLPIKNEIAYETKIYHNIRQLEAFHEARKTGTDKSLGIALQALREESFERLFFYLDLLYPHDMIQEIHEGIVEHAPGDPVRGHAVELLSNTVEPDVLLAIHRVLDPAMPPVREQAVIAVIEAFLKSGDRWLPMIAYFLAFEYGLDTRWPEIAAIERELGFKAKA